MHSECQDEITAKIKKMRADASKRLVREGFHVVACYQAPGEMRGYLKVLELLCPNPLED